MTFSAQIAPILYSRCAACHRPGQVAPFSLLTFADARRHAADISKVTRTRYMPPWLPEPGYGEFADERRLSTDEIGLLQQWVTEGTPEGNPVDLPSLPVWPEGWELGKPDLVVEMDRAYTLPAEGKEVYRNFVVPIPVSGRQFVRGIELHPGNLKAVHHVFLYVDPTPQSRLRARQSREVGFEGMQVPDSARMPDGHSLSWQPGKRASFVDPGLAWTLEPRSDLVIQMHLRPGGKPEDVRATVGFYFTPVAPTNTPMRLGLVSLDFNLPAGRRETHVKEQFELPVDVQVLRVLPHLHYLGRHLEAFATLPDGTRQWLLRIDEWDFNWQGDYRYARPVELPRGTTVFMDYAYDNSAENPRNPNHPPVDVAYGPQSSDEMAELWLQVLPKSRSDFAILRSQYAAKMEEASVQHSRNVLQKNPANAKAHLVLGQFLAAHNRDQEAVEHFLQAARLDPESSIAHFNLGLLYQRHKSFAPAKLEFERTLEIDPDDYQAHTSLGIMFLAERDMFHAEAELQRALALNPGDSLTQKYWEAFLRAKNRTDR